MREAGATSPGKGRLNAFNMERKGLRKTLSAAAEAGSQANASTQQLRRGFSMLGARGPQPSLRLRLDKTRPAA